MLKLVVLKNLDFQFWDLISLKAETFSFLDQSLILKTTKNILT